MLQIIKTKPNKTKMALLYIIHILKMDECKTEPIHTCDLLIEICKDSFMLPCVVIVHFLSLWKYSTPFSSTDICAVFHVFVMNILL